MLSRPGVRVMAGRIEGTMTDLKASGPAWPGRTIAPSITADGTNPSALSDDPVTYPTNYLGANGCTDGSGDQSASAKWIMSPSRPTRLGSSEVKC